MASYQISRLKSARKKRRLRDLLIWPEKSPEKSGIAFGDPVVDAFYASFEWRRLRLKVLKKHGRRCLCCGATPDDGVKIHVDHIKPLRFFWDKRLDFDNLQVLCEVCNHGKGNWDRTDWRPAPRPPSVSTLAQKLKRRRG